MKKTTRQVVKIVDKLCNEISWRYPNLYRSMSENRVRQILNNVCKDSKEPSST